MQTKQQHVPVKPTELVGTVVGPDEQPLAAVTVDAWTNFPGNETTTDSAGRFRLGGFESGEAVEVEFRKNGYCPVVFAAQLAGTPDWVVRMNDRTFLRGVVVDQAGEPVAGATVRAERGPFHEFGVFTGSVRTETQTNGLGEYSLYLAPDTYNITARVPGRGAVRFPAEVVADGEQRQFDIHLEPGFTFRANLICVKTGQPVEGISLWSYYHREIEGTSDSRGVVEISNMYPGRFDFHVIGVCEDRGHAATASNYARWSSEDAVYAHQRLEKLNGPRFQRNFDNLEFELAADSKPVTIYFEPLVTITGRVLDPDGEPVDGATVAPANTGTGNSLTGDTRYSCETNEDGTFTMKLPASGAASYNLVAHDGKYGEWRTWANGATEPYRTQPGDCIEYVELRLTRPATVRGTVLTDQGEPAAGKKVRAADFHKHDNRYYHPTIKTDANGRFELKCVAPGKQYIQCEPFWLDAAQAPAGTTTAVEVKSGDVVDGLQLRAARMPGPGVTGRTTNSSGSTSGRPSCSWQGGGA